MILVPSAECSVSSCTLGSFLYFTFEMLDYYFFLIEFILLSLSWF